jgi:microcystin-dependent protein
MWPEDADAHQAPMPFGSRPFWVPPGFGEAPVGSVTAFAGALGLPMPNTATPAGVAPPASSPPEARPVTVALEARGWMLCDGRTLQRADYPELFDVLGYLYGGSGETFSLPDYRGAFFRGTDLGANVDPDLGERVAPAGGGSAAGVGSTQPFALQTHEHTYLFAQTAAPPTPQGNAAGAPVSQSAPTKGGPVNSVAPAVAVKVSQNETRPSNVAVNYIIKFSYGLRNHMH